MFLVVDLGFQICYSVSVKSVFVGGKKRYYYHDDIWNLKYLPKFKWGHISEKLGKVFFSMIKKIVFKKLLRI